ncbi:MAG: exodeoxyribonuclease V subunit gamma [Mogibacterium sp.]|nr:exodeoxyribonuclease V subunit gamma [Mogibacterium sp.]
MLNIYAARESVDKERFIYQSVRGEAFIVVPDQYTLAAEEQALTHMGKACLFDVEITSMRRLGQRVLAETGRENVSALDKYGRFMLLSRIVREHRDELGMFRQAAGRATFLEMVNDFISDLKQQDRTAADIDAMLESGRAGETLAGKLTELRTIVEEYEREIAGRYTDSEDYIAMYTEAMADAALVRGKEIWIYGYDSYTPKFRNAILALAGQTTVNVVLSRSDYGLDRTVQAVLKAEAAERGVGVAVREIPAGYEFAKSETAVRIERDLFDPDQSRAAARNRDFLPADLTVTECANPYHEAESAAAFVHHLIRDEGYRMRDIVIIANDEGGMQPKVVRTFAEYGLPLFVDARRGISDSGAVSLILGLLEFVSRRHATPHLLTVLKSGLTGYDEEQIWNLENYVKGYRIRGSMWDKPFQYGGFEYAEEDFAALEALRADVMARVQALEDLVKASDQVDAFADGFRRYLAEVWQLEAKLEALAAAQAEQGHVREAQRTAQSYDAAMDILDQVVRVLGEDAFQLEEFIEIYKTGIETVDVGLIPQAADGITMGTMIRTRPLPVRAVLILGANEGVLPLEPSPEGLFSVDEKAWFSEMDFPLGGLDDLKMLEENVAMYRMMSRASEKVYISYSMTDGEGRDMKPSPLIDQVRTVFPRVAVQKDIVTQGFGLDLVNDRRETLRHLMDYIKERPAAPPAETVPPGDPAASGAAAPDLLAHAVMAWYDDNAPEVLAPMVRAGRSENRAEPLSRPLAKRLYARRDGDFSFSASSLERYDHCPFRHFVLYGLRPQGEKDFTGDRLSIGDIYHECIMRVSQRMTEDGKPRARASEEEIAVMVREELSALSEEYKGGLFVSNEREKYRLDRIASVCEDAVRALADQMERGELELLFFEERFGRGCRFAPIEYTFDGEKVFIEGKIDRVDVLSGGNVRIVDYKTGSDKLDLDQMRSGYKMQLMVYLEGTVESGLQPAGMFYFNISDRDLAASEISSDKLEKKLADAEAARFDLKGAYVNEPEITSKMPLDVINSSSIKLSREAFTALEQDVRASIARISSRILSGDIRIEPTVLAKSHRRECQNCDYQAICRFDLSYRHNNYRKV